MIYKAIFFCTLSAIATLTTANALMPPLYESIAEFKSLLDNEQLSEKLDSADYIETIQRNEDGFLIITNKHFLKATVHTEPGHMPGPARYRFVFHEAIPLLQHN